jgi:hypothetical protein
MATPRAGYRTKDGTKVPSVTTVLSRFKDSGGLIKWAYREGRKHEGMQRQGLEAPEHLYDKTATSTQAAWAGTIAHDFIESYILDGAAEGDRFARAKAQYAEEDADVKRRAWNAYQQFLKWFANTRITITHTEMGNVSEKHKYGGTLDAIGRDSDGQIVLIDWKSSNAVYGEYLIQLGAYSMLLEENHPELTPTGFHLLRVAKESADFAHHHYGDLKDEKEAFLLMRSLYELVYKIEKRA